MRKLSSLYPLSHHGWICTLVIKQQNLSDKSCYKMLIFFQLKQLLAFFVWCYEHMKYLLYLFLKKSGKSDKSKATKKPQIFFGPCKFYRKISKNTYLFNMSKNWWTLKRGGYKRSHTLALRQPDKHPCRQPSEGPYIRGSIHWNASYPYMGTLSIHWDARLQSRGVAKW